MRTPIHVRTTARSSSPSVRNGQATGQVVLGDLIVSAGPKDDAGRLVRVYLTRAEAQGLAASLDALLAE